MAEFARYYLDFLTTFFRNFGDFFMNGFSAFKKVFNEDVPGYINALKESSVNFNAGGWILYILVTIINCALAFFIFYYVFQLLRRYVFFRAKEVTKDKLMEQIAILEKKNDLLTEEKNKILELKANENADGVVSIVDENDYDYDSDGEIIRGESRFTKLIDLDARYKKNPAHMYMAEEDLLTLPEVVDRFVNFAGGKLKLFYTDNVIRIFLSALGTGKLIILEGISGTGKTSLPYAMGKFFKHPTNIISVQPSWRDRAELLGYLNEFTKKFNETDFLRAVYEASLREEPNFIVLDEMNLARIEYYFAEFLSIMEIPDKSAWKIDLVPTSLENDPKGIIYGKLLLPQNLWYIGTANNDDSTFTITDKVYDRAVSISLNTKANAFEAKDAEPWTCTYEYLQSLFDKAHKEYSVSDESLDKIKELDVLIQNKFRVAFGNRIMKQLRLFTSTFMACGGEEYDALDFIISSKILRKFGALNLPFLGKELQSLKALFNKNFGKGRMTLCLDMIDEYLKQS